MNNIISIAKTNQVRGKFICERKIKVPNCLRSSKDFQSWESGAIDERLGHRSFLSRSRFGHVMAAWWKVSSSSMHSRQVRSWSTSYGFGWAAS